MDWQTNKAHFFIEKREVRKRYFRVGDAARDATLLQLIEAAFRETEYDGWRYRALRVVSADTLSNEILMERLHGVNLKELFSTTKDPRLFVHAGRWLGLLHRASGDGSGTVLSFNDYNISNVIVSSTQHEVVAVDPGNYSSARSHPSCALFVGVFSVSRCVLRVRPFVFKNALGQFVRGYLHGTRQNRLPQLLPGFGYVAARIRLGHSRTIVRRPALLRALLGVAECFVLLLAMKLLGRGRHC